jgi:hypothetical protein
VRLSWVGAWESWGRLRWKEREMLEEQKYCAVEDERMRRVGGEWNGSLVRHGGGCSVVRDRIYSVVPKMSSVGFARDAALVLRKRFEVWWRRRYGCAASAVQ